jgi:hypothetical protein
MTLRTFFLSLPLALSFACGGDSMGADADKFAELANEVCKCANKECADKAKEKWEKLEEEMEKKYEGKKDLDEKAMKEASAKVEAAEDKARDCAKKFAGGGDAPAGGEAADPAAGGN